MRRARERQAEQIEKPVVGVTTLVDDLAVVAEAQRRAGFVDYLGGRDTWEPPCVACGNVIGYTCKLNTYVARTLCGACSGESMEDRLRSSGISFRELHQPLSALRNHDPEGRPYGHEYDRWLEFLQRFAQLKPGARLDPPFAFACGSNGVGKSAGAERALRDAIRNGCSGRVVTFRELVRRIVSSYGRDAKDVDERADDVVRIHAGIHLLVIQEVGMEDPTEHNYGLFFDFVDARWRACLPTIFTSNYAPEQKSLGLRMTERSSDDTKMHAILDRIAGGLSKDGERVNFFELVGKSWRGKEIA